MIIATHKDIGNNFNQKGYIILTLLKILVKKSLNFHHFSQGLRSNNRHYQEQYTQSNI